MKTKNLFDEEELIELINCRVIVQTEGRFEGMVGTVKGINATLKLPVHVQLDNDKEGSETDFRPDELKVMMMNKETIDRKYIETAMWETFIWLAGKAQGNLAYGEYMALKKKYKVKQ